MAKVTHEFDLYGKHYVLEAGELAQPVPVWLSAGILRYF